MAAVQFGTLKDSYKSMPEGVVPPASRIPTAGLTEFTAVQLYAVLTISLTTARAVIPLGSITLPDGTTVANWVANNLAVTVFPAGATLAIGLGDALTTPTASGMMTVSSTFPGISGIPFTQLYLTNAAQPGVSVQLVLAWVD